MAELKSGTNDGENGNLAGTNSKGEASTSGAGKKNCILVNSRQKGNPLLQSIHNVPWEFAEIEPDYVMCQTVCALYLSVRYYNLYPQYIHDRLKALGKSYQLRILLVQIDVSDPYPALKDLSKIAILTDCTLILAWSSEEAGKYLETFKIFENKSPDLIMEKLEEDTYSKLVESLTSVKSVNKTDAMTLLSSYNTMEKLFQASSEEMSLCPGMGTLKAKRLYDTIHQPFLKEPKK